MVVPWHYSRQQVRSARSTGTRGADVAFTCWQTDLSAVVCQSKVQSDADTKLV